ncbi:Predicted N-acetyltransferase YhbS [Halobacillus dabanensis]|uniref:Predicted N-acetyltransferase YhbS n=1 Tax=Halobacillus dabanensis TaxID=240302 RepID=A0A1I3PVW9_HALDA|nr:N-acetyltransferase [Halobacillus dabanensis]SFJ25555.1 Predicted N-acetyltransferase YhbS [Halobacillus dabanensis]
MVIRQEQETEYQMIERVIIKAFENLERSDQTEHKLVTKLRNTEGYIPELALVATEDGEIVGHILLTKIQINNGTHSVTSLALAPVSVLPREQNKGIGKKLVQKGLQHAKQLGFPSVIVLGHPDYYVKFGFAKASSFDIHAPFEVPDEAFMALELEKGALEKVSGIVDYPPAFS